LRLLLGALEKKSKAQVKAATIIRTARLLIEFKPRLFI
jgi:hypothetical protein